MCCCCSLNSFCNSCSALVSCCCCCSYICCCLNSSSRRRSSFATSLGKFSLSACPGGVCSLSLRCSSELVADFSVLSSRFSSDSLAFPPSGCAGALFSSSCRGILAGEGWSSLVLCSSFRRDCSMSLIG